MWITSGNYHNWHCRNRACYYDGTLVKIVWPTYTVMPVSPYNGIMESYSITGISITRMNYE